MSLAGTKQKGVAEKLKKVREWDEQKRVGGQLGREHNFGRWRRDARARLSESENCVDREKEMVKIVCAIKEREDFWTLNYKMAKWQNNEKCNNLGNSEYF